MTPDQRAFMRLLLSTEELACLKLIAEGRTNLAIANSLGLSEDCVKRRNRNVFTKLGARDRAHAVALGYRLEILEL
jgi:DNA-binding NarL/FixJ family response regulator